MLDNFNNEKPIKGRGSVFSESFWKELNTLTASGPEVTSRQRIHLAFVKLTRALTAPSVVRSLRDAQTSIGSKQTGGLPVVDPHVNGQAGRFLNKLRQCELRKKFPVDKTLKGAGTQTSAMEKPRTHQRRAKF